MHRVQIPARFCGPPGSANGGWACGTLGRFVGARAEVTLRSPPPLDVEMSVVETPDGLELRAGETLVAQARPATLALDPPLPVAFDDATAATAGFRWRETHPFPTCFVCGPKRGPDALRIYPGAVANRDVAAASWIVPEDLRDADGIRPELLWSTLDCPSWFGYCAFHDDYGPVMLGRLTADIRHRPDPGQRCVVAGWKVSREGRKINCGSVVWSETGDVLAVGHATWIELKSRDA
jgi:hypothetical protein